MTNNIKSAIACVFSAIINADGIITTEELNFVDFKPETDFGISESNEKNKKEKEEEKRKRKRMRENALMHKYGIEDDDFKDISMTFADAVNAINTDVGKEYMEKKRKKTKGSFYDDLMDLARVDGCIHPKEALLCLAFKLAAEGAASLVSLNNNELRLSEQEIVYVDKRNGYPKKKLDAEMEEEQGVEIETEQFDKIEENEKQWSEKIDAEIDSNYDVIRYMLQSFGFQFIYIRKVRKTFLKFKPNYVSRLIRDHYPDIYSNEYEKLHEQFRAKLQSNMAEETATKEFCNMLFGEKTNELKPSFLIKIGCTQKRNTNKADFIVLNIGDKGSLATLQSFLQAYDELFDRTDVLVQRGKTSREVNIESFHGAFLEFLYGRVKEIKITMRNVYNKNKKNKEEDDVCLDFRFSDLDQFSVTFSKTIRGFCIALYLTELYYSQTDEGFFHKLETIESDNNTERYKEQYERFSCIYKELAGIPYQTENEEVEDAEERFYRVFEQNRNKIWSELFGNKMPEKSYIMKYFPPYDKKEKKVLIPMATIMCNVSDRRFKKKFEGQLKDWIENLK